MSLFDNIGRDTHAPAGYSQSEFDFLNISARPAAVLIRETLDYWFNHLPVTEMETFRQRFRSSINVQHRSAFFELLLHELFLKLGCDIEIHPVVDNATTTPDFRIILPGGKSFYTEAILATDDSVDEASAQARMNAVYDGLNKKLISPNFFIGMKIMGTPKTPPSIKRIVSFLHKHLEEVNPDDLSTLLLQKPSFRSLPHWDYSHDGWHISFFPIPKSPSARGKPNVRPIGFQMPEFKMMDDRVAIRDAIIKKAGKYGELDLPYLIAVNMLHFADDIDVMEALFGKEQFTITYNLDNPSEIVNTEMTRALDGAWISHGGPRYTRVSGVFIFSRASMWSIAKTSCCIYHNPWAKNPLHNVSSQICQAIPSEGEMEVMPGESLSSILGIPPEWPSD